VGRRNKGLRSVTHLTAVGHVTVRRRVWAQPAGGLDAPADEWLNGRGARISVGARERCCRVGCHPHGFRRAAGDLKRLAGISISPERLRQVVEGEGRRVQARRQAGDWSATWRGADCGTSAGATRVYVGIDGFMAPMVTEAEKQKRRAAWASRRAARRVSRAVHRSGAARRRPRRGYRERYKEFKLTACYDQSKRRRHVLATAGGPQQVGRGLRRAARQLGLKAVDEVVAIVDGAPWIRGLLKRFAGCDHVGLDFYHFSEHVAEAARTCWGENTQASAGWRDKVVHLALEQDADAVLDEITRQRTALRSATKRAALSRLRNYVGERVGMIRYAESRARGWDIGSGPTESLCKRLSRRLKGPGMRWDPSGAEAMLQLAALQESNDWDQYWKREVQRN
jgi:hypothetical protein